jgi:hypothetical protein
MQVSTISKHYTFPIQTCKHTFLMQVSTISQHYTFPIQTCQNCVHMQVSTISQHYTFPIQNCQNCVHRQMSTIPNGFIFPTLLSTISFTTLFLHKITKVGLVSSFLMKVYPKSQNSSFSHLLTDFPNESLSKIAKSGLHSSSQLLLQQKSTQNRKIWDMAECPYGPFAFLSNIHGHRTLKAPHPV